MRSVAEWLVLPLFLLPVVVGVGLGVWARDRHVRELAHLRDGGAEMARAWLEGSDGRAVGLPREAIARYAPGSNARGDDACDFVPFVHPAGHGAVRLETSGLGPEPWIISGAFPAGLSPEALANDDVRLQIEIGRTPMETGDVDAATLALKRLLNAPDLEVLRTAPLPAATKLFVLRRWQARGGGDPRWANAAKLLAVLRVYEQSAEGTAKGFPPGAHEIGTLLAFSPGEGQPLLLFPDARSVHPSAVLVAEGAPEDPARLVWTFPASEEVPGDVLWEGDLKTPLAGRWRWVSKYGTAWWRTPRVQRWAGPVLLVLAAFLFLPVALLVAMRRRRRQEEARIRFLNELAHDLRTPLTSLRLHAELLARGTTDAKKRTRYEETVTREAARLSGLLANVLDLSRLERGRRNLDAVPLRLREVIDQSVSEFVATHPARADDVRLEGDDQVRVLADATVLGRVLANLLDNAGKFTEPGTHIDLRWDDAGSRTRLVLADEGPGIPVGEEQRVFDRYVRGRAQERAGVPGTGLGLSLVRELVQEMDGTVVLLPSSKGAVFEIRLPEPTDD